MGWFSDVAWLVGEWFLLLALSTLIGLAIGWFLWRRTATADQARVLAEQTQAEQVAAERNSTAHTLAAETAAGKLATMTEERDQVRVERDRFRTQLATIESLVGAAESSESPTVEPGNGN